MCGGGPPPGMFKARRGVLDRADVVMGVRYHFSTTLVALTVFCVVVPLCSRGGYRLMALYFVRIRVFSYV